MIALSASAKLRRRWFQFSLRSILLLLTAIAIGPGGWALYEQHQARRQKAAVARLATSGGEVYAQPLWLWTLLEKDAPGRVVGIAIRDRMANDASVAPLADLTDLIWLDLNDTCITDAGIAPVARLGNLKRLRLDETQVTDAGLVQLTGLTNLETLNLSRTKVTDAGLVHLVGFKKLETLDLARTSVTDAGVANLKKALPNLQVGR